MLFFVNHESFQSGVKIKNPENFQDFYLDRSKTAAVYVTVLLKHQCFLIGIFKSVYIFTAGGGKARVSAAAALDFFG